MELIGYMDSPYVRRVAISAHCLGVAFQHRELSIWRDYDAFREINPLVKVPTVVLPDGTVLVESGLIIDWLERQADGRSLWPSATAEYQQALSLTGIAVVSMEKSVQLIYDRRVTGALPDRRKDWVKRLHEQLHGALGLLEAAAQGADEWLLGNELTQADVSAAVAWRFANHASAVEIEPSHWPALGSLSERAEALPEFKACPLSD